jgi:Ribosomal L27e protein family
VNYNHIMPTRYALEVDLKPVVTSEAVDNSSKRVDANKVRGGACCDAWHG